MGTNDDNSTKLPDEVLADLMSLISAIDEEAPTPAAPVIPAVKKRTPGSKAEVKSKATSKSAATTAKAKTKAAPKASSTKAQASQTQSPETQAPETQEPETQEPETQSPETQSPETQSPETQEPETQEPETQEPETQVAEPAGLLPKSPPVPPGPKPTSFAELTRSVDEPAQPVALPVVQLPEVPAAEAKPLPGVVLDEPVEQPAPLRETPELGELVAAAPADAPKRASRDLLDGVASTARLANPSPRASASWFKYNWPFLLAGFFIAIGAVLIVLVLTSN